MYAFARSQAGTLNSQVIEALEATYVSTGERSLDDVVKEAGKPDLIVEATGNSQIAFDCMRVSASTACSSGPASPARTARSKSRPTRSTSNGCSATKCCSARVNANREHFELGIRDLALGEFMYPGVIERILTNPVDGLDNYKEMMRLLVEEKSALKVYMNVAAD